MREKVVPEILRYAEHIEAARGELPGVTVRYEDLTAALDEALGSMSPSRAAADVAARLNVPRKRAYTMALERSK